MCKSDLHREAPDPDEREPSESNFAHEMRTAGHQTLEQPDTDRGLKQVPRQSHLADRRQQQDDTFPAWVHEQQCKAGGVDNR
ncbi:MAG: hypothetical protein M3480_04620 [Verrucomicrobiota bacterium]|nr:hypothetical protein [Verrucomicrobiota bacterium]